MLRAVVFAALLCGYVSPGFADMGEFVPDQKLLQPTEQAQPPAKPDTHLKKEEEKNTWPKTCRDKSCLG